MQVTCDVCRQPVEDTLCQIIEEGREILYVCPDCYVKRQEQGPEYQP